MKTIQSMTLLGTCSSFSERECEEMFKRTRECSGKLLRRRIKKFLPYLYNYLNLDLKNPFEEQSVCRKGLYIYVHSATEYFIQVEYASKKRKN